MMRALVASVLHLVITPVILFVYGLTPDDHLDFFSPHTTSLERLTAVSVFALWAVWAWGVWSVFVAARRGSARLHRAAGLTAPHIVLAFAALLAALGGEGSPAGTQIDNKTIVKSDGDDEPRSLAQIETAALATLAGFVLQQFFHRQIELIRRAHRGVSYERHSRLAQLSLHRLLALRKREEVNKQCQVNSSGSLPSIKSSNDDWLLPLGYGPSGFVSIRLARKTVITLESFLDANGIVTFIESVVNLTVWSGAQFTSVTREHGLTVVQIDLCEAEESSDSEVVEYRLRSAEDAEWVLLEPGNVKIIPFTFSLIRPHEFSTLSNCLQLTPVAEIIEPSHFDASQAVDLVVRVMGPLEIVCSNGRKVHFRKSKSAELLAWLVLHRDRPSRDLARTAMWDSNVQDSTFNNVVSELRRAVKSASPSLDLTESRHQRFIALPDGIRSDVDIMEGAWVRARQVGSSEEWLKVYECAQAIRGLPFESSSFEWADAEGLTSHIMLKVMNVCGDLAEYFLRRGEVDRVFHVTELGLRALPGSEEMLEWRQKALAARSTVKL